MQERLDKFLANAALGTRKEIKHFINKGLVLVDNQIVKDPSEKFDFDKCQVVFDGEIIENKRTVVGVLNKPAGFVTSTDDPINETVMQLVPKEYLRLGVVPVGRLDKDTEGVLLFTNDGELLHKLISPKSNVPKTYYATFEGTCPTDAVERFKEGIVLKDSTVCKSADFKLLSDHEFQVTITQGLYHQVKRMAAACGMHITYLRRESFGNVTTSGLEKGQFKEIENF